MKINLLTTKQVAQRLGVKTQSIYAYVSRGQLSRVPSKDGRHSLFRADEVETMARRGRPRVDTHSVGSVEVSLTSSITGLSPTALRYRGHAIDTLYGVHGFESVAELLWTGSLPSKTRWDKLELHSKLRRQHFSQDATPIDRFMACLVELASHDPLRIALTDLRVMAAGRHMISAFVASLPPLRQSSRSMRRPTLAALLWPRVSPLAPQPERVALLDKTLVLLADHELATSTLAARVAASTRAHPFAVVMAGLSAFSGPLHGKAPELTHRVMRAALHTSPPELALAQTLSQTRLTPGFGHPVYTDGDVRAKLLLPDVRAIAKVRERGVIDAIAKYGAENTGKAPNVDFALAALAFACDMPLGATEAMFAIARTAGLIAHAIEEYGEAPLRFRARALYVGR